MENNEIRFKAIDLTQSQIQRMAKNSFSIKKWAIVLITATLIIKIQMFWLALIPLIAFWYLDAWFLRIERMYRKKYERIINGEQDNFNELFDLNPHNYSENVDSEIRIMLSKTLFYFYGSILLLIIFCFFIAVVTHYFQYVNCIQNAIFRCL